MAAAAAPTRPEAAAPQLLDTQHEDHVHDVAWDYYARRLATCSSDGTVKIFAADGEATAHEATITGHGAPSGRSAGRTPGTARSWRAAATTARSSSTRRTPRAAGRPCTRGRAARGRR